MILYQLPNGKVIHLSVEQYLDLTDQDLQDMMAGNYGEYPTSHWIDSAIRSPRKQKEQKDIDKSIDYTEDSDEIVIQSTTFAIITVDDINSSENIEDNSSEELEDT